MNRGLIFLVLVFLPFLAQSQLRGKVSDAKSQEPLEFASVAVYKTLDSTLVEGSITDVSGVFLIENVPAGSYFLKVSFIGFQTLTGPAFDLTKNEALDFGTISLLPDQQQLEGVEVQGQKITSDFKLDKQSYSAENFEVARGGFATDILKNLPGISINGEGQISIRGTSGFVVMLNGKPIQGDPMMILSQLPANGIEKVEWISSPGARYDSEGKAGMINITTVRGTTDGLYLQVNSRLGFPSIETYDNAANPRRYGADFNLNYLKGKWDLSLGASYQRNDLSGRRVGDVFTVRGDTTTFFPSEGERSTVEVNYSGRFTLGFNPDPNNSFSLGFFAGVRDKVRTADILYFDNRAEVNGQRLYTMQYFNANEQQRRGDFVLGSLDYAHIFADKSKLSTSFLYEYTMLGGPTTNRNLGYPDMTEVLQDEFNTNDNPLNGWRVNLDYAFKPLSIGQVQVGYQYRNLDHRGDFIYKRKNNETGIFELVPEFSSKVDLKYTIHAGYLQLDKQLNKLSYGAGLRLEVMDRNFNLQDRTGTLDTLYVYGYFRPFACANVGYQVNEELQLKASFSQRVERTTTFKMNPFPEREHSETLEQGDSELLPEFINQVEVGLVKNWKDNSFYATAYHSRVKNLVNRVNTVFNDTILNRIYSNVGTAKSTGIDLGAELFPANWWKFFAGFNSFYYSINGSFDDRPVNSSSWVYSINLTSSFVVAPTVSIQASFNYLSKRVTAQGEDGRF
ncbi:outer membrane beta-barrel family protein [Cognataquiflexum rubidum]|uniref:outer membrane beta-barrel family protein n=1 Tax=Cognataquiflexum rubidum TaxID=2922273 RepID=UPI001F130BBA|nr:outer membrane beta-barrel family protein [Cognataquiflexum rubidum]MCH6233651.1 TonB-dependent receptor family protein [Cognataquiflexum rubidum]